jgi:hypothetical protein
MFIDMWKDVKWCVRKDASLVVKSFLFLAGVMVLLIVTLNIINN